MTKCQSVARRVRWWCCLTKKPRLPGAQIGAARAVGIGALAGGERGSGGEVKQLAVTQGGQQFGLLKLRYREVTVVHAIPAVARVTVKGARVTLDGRMRPRPTMPLDWHYRCLRNADSFKPPRPDPDRLAGNADKSILRLCCAHSAFQGGRALGPLLANPLRASA